MNSSPNGATSTPASSPPAESLDVDEKDVSNTNDAKGVSTSMEEEERKMMEARRKTDEKKDRKLEQQREEDIKGGKEVVDTKYKALEFLLSQSKVMTIIGLPITSAS